MFQKGGWGRLALPNENTFWLRDPDQKLNPRVKRQTGWPGNFVSFRARNVGGKALVFVPPALAFPEDKWATEIPRGAAGVFSGIA
jgi:hypothetical protein